MLFKRVLKYAVVFGGVTAFVMTGCQGKSNSLNEGKISETQDKDNIGDDVSSKLETENEKVDQDKEGKNTENKPITVYFVEDESGEVTGENIEITDENDIWSALQDKGVLTTECRLLSFKIDESQKKIDLDFDSATGKRIRSMGTTGEMQIIGCIVNTFLEAYNCDSIRLTENGMPLETSHGATMDGYSGAIVF